MQNQLSIQYADGPTNQICVQIPAVIFLSAILTFMSLTNTWFSHAIMKHQGKEQKTRELYGSARAPYTSMSVFD